MVAAAEQFLARGMLTIPEAAMYARVDPRLFHRWLFGTERNGAALTREINDRSDERLITFVDFIQMLTVRAIRTLPTQVPLNRVKQAVQFLRDEHGIEFPFARQHTLYGFEGEIVYQTAQGDYMFASGKEKRQFLERQIVEPHLEHLSYDASGLANVYRIHSSREIDIVMKAGIRFSEPMMPSGYTARTLYDAVHSEGSYGAAAEAFQVDEIEVKVAYEWFDTLQRPAA